MRRAAGFTLVELIAVITLTGIIAAVIWRNVAQPLEGFEDTTRRARLVDIAETTLNRMTREIRLALPNSIRIATSGTSTGLEFLRTLTGGRYRREADASDDVCAGGGASDDILDFTLASDCFEILGGVPVVPDATHCPGGCLLAIYNTGSVGANAYDGDNTATIDTATATATSLTFTRGTAFPFASPFQRFHVIDTPVSFVCDTAGDEIRRYDGYAIAPAQSVPPAGSGDLLADHVEACSFSYSAGTASRAGLVTLKITVTDQSVSSGANESVTLVDQVHIPNVP
jgi:MSHA biogenesis protein MshO